MIARFTGNGHETGLALMLVLPMAPAGSHETPAIFLEDPEQLAYLHVNRRPPSTVSTSPVTKSASSR
jgi:hypothetical protein